MHPDRKSLLAQLYKLEHMLTERVGKRIRHIRRQKGLSQASLADKVGLSQASICQIEQGDRKQVKDSVLERIAEALDVRVDDLVVDGSEAFDFLERLSDDLCDELRSVAGFPEDRQREVANAIRWLVEWRYKGGMKT